MPLQTDETIAGSESGISRTQILLRILYLTPEMIFSLS